ncbi:dienelactone hydrolase [Pseudomassariella vexata]|uniref:Dienelactone hydrolase n=1 Tax=Pseudomassariella vexata TaxID=1141098 RepID=A0A1Y2DRA9_9PEZI|nr:dienelactone hydrolase [Pseudomassariella vexata]ORY61800.1 dienelactone hydrolase [Pseudomassariella vexata]
MATIAYPPAKCCTVGVKHEGTPTGQDIKVGKYDAYLAVPESSKVHKDAGILFIPDVICIWQNSKLMADQYAANGYLCLIIDVFNGDPLSLNRSDDFDFIAWLTKGSTGDNPHTAEHVDPIVKEAIKYLTEEKGIKKLGAVGYCFGAKYVARHYPSIQVGFMAHPSFVDEDEFRAFKAPLSIAAAETDAIFPTDKRHRAEVILAEKGHPYQINLYSQVVHGFSVRCDLSNKVEKYAREQAFLQAVTWFDTWLI